MAPRLLTAVTQAVTTPTGAGWRWSALRPGKPRKSALIGARFRTDKREVGGSSPPRPISVTSSPAVGYAAGLFTQAFDKDVAKLSCCAG